MSILRSRTRATITVTAVAFAGVTLAGCSSEPAAQPSATSSSSTTPDAPAAPVAPLTTVKDIKEAMGEACAEDGGYDNGLSFASQRKGVTEHLCTVTDSPAATAAVWLWQEDANFDGMWKSIVPVRLKDRDTPTCAVLAAGGTPRWAVEYADLAKGGVTKAMRAQIAAGHATELPKPGACDG